VQVVDVSDPTNPQRAAYFVPLATQNPVKPAQRSVLTNTTQVWGVVVDEATGLVYASDMNSGLWILRRTN
jgi:myo-inositol-hexaphosphate 3-phosphohydrolase